MSDEARARAREQLAAYAHEAWSGWMRYLFSLSTYPDSSGAKIPGELVERWLRQLNTPYIDLSEAEKDSDRAEADKMLDIVWAAARAEGEAAGREAAAREVENNISGSSYDGVDALLGAIAAAIRARKEGTRCD